MPLGVGPVADLVEVDSNLTAACLRDVSCDQLIVHLAHQWRLTLMSVGEVDVIPRVALLSRAVTQRPMHLVNVLASRRALELCHTFNQFTQVLLILGPRHTRQQFCGG